MDQMVRMKSHVIAYRLLELLFGTHTFHFNCFFEDFNCVFTQIRCLSRVLKELRLTRVLSNTALRMAQGGARGKILADRIRISEILPWDRKSYLTHAIIPRTSSNVIL